MSMQISSTTTLSKPPESVVFLSPAVGDADHLFEQLAQILATIAERVARQHGTIAETN